MSNDIDTVSMPMVSNVDASLQFNDKGLELVICNSEGTIQDQLQVNMYTLVEEHLPFHYVISGFRNRQEKIDFIILLSNMQEEIERAKHLVEQAPVDNL